MQEHFIHRPIKEVNGLLANYVYRLVLLHLLVQARAFCTYVYRRSQPAIRYTGYSLRLTHIQTSTSGSVHLITA